MNGSNGILDKVNSIEDLKKLEYDKLEPLCQDIRDFLIKNLSKSGGHLASNLGTVELTVALHRVFNSPKDKIIWDVGHQAYTHKILTGRKDKFYSIRQKGGLSGFPTPKESEHDAFVAGHSSTSLAAALGMARAKTVIGDDGYVIAVIGDGATSGGMFFEGLNNIGRYNDRIIVILNDNKISISKNIGALAKYLSEIRVRPKYFKFKDVIDRIITNIPFIGKWLKRKIVRSKSMLKYALYHSTWFEQFGFNYFGPVDGHDIKSLTEVLNRAKALNKPVFIHAETIKGKGYKYAEENPGAYHGVKPFNPNKGNSCNITSDGFSKQFGKKLIELGKNDPKIFALCPAMKYATGLDEFAQIFPRRFIDVGIAEQLAITCAAGVATSGLIPVVAVYSSFLQRAYDQILHDAAICKTHIVLAIDRAGIVGEDGETHQGIFDVSFLSGIPGVTIYSPSSYLELSECLKTAIYDEKGVVAVRYPKGKEPLIDEKYNVISSKFSLFSENSVCDILVITYGRIFENCIKAKALAEIDNINVDILKLTKLSITDEIIDIAKKYNKIIFVEEGIERGSISELFADTMLRNGFNGIYKKITLGNNFILHQSIEQAFEEYGLNAEGILKIIKE